MFRDRSRSTRERSQDHRSNMVCHGGLASRLRVNLRCCCRRASLSVAGDIPVSRSVLPKHERDAANCRRAAHVGESLSPASGSRDRRRHVPPTASVHRVSDTLHVCTYTSPPLPPNISRASTRVTKLCESLDSRRPAMHIGSLHLSRRLPIPETLDQCIVRGIDRKGDFPQFHML